MSTTTGLQRSPDKPEQSHRCLKDSRLRALYNLLRGHEQHDREDSRQKAIEHLDALERDYPRETPVLLLALDAISRQAEPDAQGFYDRLSIIIDDMVITETRVKMILYLAQQLNRWSLDLAARSIEVFILQRAAVEKYDFFLQKAFISYIWIHASLPGAAGVDALVDFIPKLTCVWPSRLCVEASHAALLLMWKKMNSAFASGDLDAAERWIELALYPIFSNFGDENREKIQRKLLSCALRRHDADPNFQLTGILPEPGKSEPLTIFLLFKAALGKDDPELASNCILSLCRDNPDVSTYIFACVAEAQKTTKAALLRSAIGQLLDKVDKSPLGKADVALLLKCAIRLDIEELEKKDYIDSPLVQHLCDIFELSYTIENYQLPEQESSISDFEWFSRNSYNLALQYCCKWESRHVLHLLKTCIKTLDLYPIDLGSEARSDVKIRRLMCSFLAAVVCVTQARAEGNIQFKTNHCMNAKAYIENFRSGFQSQIEQIKEDFHSELHDKYRSLLAFDFEASIQLREWSHLDILLDEARNLSNDGLYTMLADAILRSGAPSVEITKLFGKIVKDIQAQNLYNISTMSRWLRCLFQLALESDVQIAEEVLSQAHALAQRASNQSSESEQYPAEELEWLSATVYNIAIDFYLASDDAVSRRWYEMSVGISRLLDDGGYLSQVLEEKFSALTWGE